MQVYVYEYTYLLSYHPLWLKKYIFLKASIKKNKNKKNKGLHQESTERLHLSKQEAPPLQKSLVSVNKHMSRNSLFISVRPKSLGHFCKSIWACKEGFCSENSSLLTKHEIANEAIIPNCYQIEA